MTPKYQVPIKLHLPKENPIQSSVKICLIGPPNSGKSQLFNTLLQNNVSPVSKHKLTTVESVHSQLILNNLGVQLQDTGFHWEGLENSDLIALIVSVRDGVTP
jgi:tRNA U34 5-carboxymethylaminomethyl modifying GTPase MnmE/TrmE